MFYDIFKQLCVKKGVSCHRAAIDMGFSNSITTKWKKTCATPNGETLNKIADYFGVTVGDLLERADDAISTCTNSHQTAPMDEDEADILRIYRKLPRKSKHEFMAVVYDFEKREELTGDNGPTAAV